MSSSRLTQTIRHLSRRRQRQVLIGIGSCLGLATGTGLSMRSSARVRFDGPAATPTFSGHAHIINDNNNNGGRFKEKLDPEIMKQLSGGSVAGFVTGVLVSVFSRTLVLLLGISVVVLQVAARYGINIVDQLRIKQRVGNSKVLAALERDPAFKLTFGLFFALSAFTKF